MRNNSIIYKDYLKGKTIRLLVFVKKEEYYIPFSIVKKTSIKWYNITKENVSQLFSTDIRKVLSDFENNKYSIYKIEI